MCLIDFENALQLGLLQNSGIKQHGQESLTSSRSERECVST